MNYQAEQHKFNLCEVQTLMKCELTENYAQAIQVQ